MKKSIIVLFFLSFAIFGNSQGFIVNTTDIRDERPMEIYELNNFYLISGSIEIGNVSQSYLLKYTKNGGFIKKTEFDTLSIAGSVIQKKINDIEFINLGHIGKDLDGDYHISYCLLFPDYSLRLVKL